MTAVLLDGKKLKEELLLGLEQKVKEKGLKPVLGTILVGGNESSRLYVRLKEQACKQVGGEFILKELPETASTKNIVDAINEFNENERVTGILLQLPLPKGVSYFECLKAISPEKDVDGLNPLNIGGLLQGESRFTAATAKGIIVLLKHYGIELRGTNALVIGRSSDVGIPVAAALLKEDATVTIAHSKTRNLKELCLKSDIVVSSTSRPGLINAGMIKPGAVVVDVGISFQDGKVVGNVSLDVAGVAGFLTPVPGGVGPMTIASLMQNLVESSEGARV
ncbi:MAG: bifunctional 5,10-methylenetetrahydrofolate dehydrogenase/5,10-methenyltetrahydrofolate cyclohydrolase [Candidatus Micrarchaeota archaeon]